MKREFIQIYWTCGDIKEARLIAGYLVEKQLVACANIIPQVESIFFWENKVQSEKEVVVLLKTVKEKFEKVKGAILERASYEVPAILQIPIVDGNEEYLIGLLQWLKT